jgi:hypothetical protein
MKFLKPFFLFEALDLPTAKKLTKIFIDSGGKERFQEIFKGEDRIYYDFFPQGERKESILQKRIEKELQDNGFSIVSYLEGTAKKVGDDKNIFKIQKLLTRWGLEDLKSQMNSDPERSLSRHASKKIVISRHGIDLGGASTDRSWTSCLALDAGVNSRYIPTMIEAGALIAYLIDPADLNINKPLSRIKINPFVNQQDPSKFLMYPDPNAYGNYKNHDFMAWVEKWSIDLNKKINPEEGDYFLDSRCYADGRSKVTMGTTINLAKDLERTFDQGRWIGPGSSYDRGVKVGTEYSFENFYDNIINEKVRESTIESLIDTLRAQNLLDLVISYVNGEDNKKTENAFSEHTRLLNGFLKFLKKDIFRINEEKSKIIVTTIFNRIPPEAQELILANSKMIRDKNPDFIDWLRENIFKFNLVDPKFVSPD